MATRTLGVIRDENLHTHIRGPSRKALTNITNSSKLSSIKGAEPKKNLLKKSDNSVEQNGLYINPGFGNSNMKSNFKGDSVGGKLKVSDGQKKPGLGGGGVRRPLGDITNSRKLSVNQESKKNNLKKPNDIASEGFLHDHQKCIKSQNSEMDGKLLLKTLGFDDDFCKQLSKPAIVPASLPPKVPASVPPKVDSFSSLMPLEYDEIPELLYEVRSPPRCRTPEHHITSPSMDRYALSPTLMLLGSP